MSSIVGYTYQADIYCPACAVNKVIMQRDMYHENYEAADHDREMRNLAVLCGIDYDNQHSYDSDDFPKPILFDQLEDNERCGNCHESIE